MYSHFRLHRYLKPVHKYYLTVQYNTMSTSTSKPILYNTIDSMRTFLQTQRHKRIGLVPTMGALHTGHIDLVKQCNKLCDLTIVSIYVNPTQFAANEDLSTYPRTLESDIQQLQQHNIHHIFTPSNSIMYPTHDTYGNPVEHCTWINNDTANKVGEGATRPTHFRGVLTVVNKLFNIIQPAIAVFGQKDGLQCIVIKKMVSDLNIPVQIITVPTHRATDGLALSSRNVYLTDAERKEAPILYNSLHAVQHEFYDNGVRNVAQLRDTVYNILSAGKLGKLDYINITYASTGTEVTDSELSNTQEYMIAIAYKLGKPRLIDNCILSPHDTSHRI